MRDAVKRRQALGKRSEPQNPIVFYDKKISGEDACPLEGIMVLIAYYVIFIIAGTLSDYFIGLIVEREFGSYASLLFFLVFYFLVLWLSWLIAVRITNRTPPRRARHC